METPTTGSDAYSDNTDAATGKPVSYKDFVSLWSHLLNPSRIKVFMFLYDNLMLLSVSPLPAGAGESL